MKSKLKTAVEIAKEKQRPQNDADITEVVISLPMRVPSPEIIDMLKAVLGEPGPEGMSVFRYHPAPKGA